MGNMTLQIRAYHTFFQDFTFTPIFYVIFNHLQRLLKVRWPTDFKVEKRLGKKIISIPF